MSILSIIISCGGFLFFGLLYLSIYVNRCYWRSQAMKLGHGERKVGRLMRSVGELREALEAKDAEMAGLEHRCDALREELVRARTELAQVQNQAVAGPSEPPRYVVSSFRQRFCDGGFDKMTKAMIKQLATDGNGVLNYLASKLDRNCEAQSNAFLTRVARRHNLPLDGMSEKNIGDRLEAFFAKEPAFAKELLLVEFGVEGFQVRPGMTL